MKTTDSQHRLLELMSSLNITQQDIADRTGIDKSSISLYVNGKREPRQDKVGIISEAYGLDPAWLMGYDVPMMRETTAAKAKRHADLITKFSRLSEKDQTIILNMIDSMLEKTQ